jgi:hypothetical protein
MVQYIDKSAVVAEIKKCYNECLKRAKINDSDYWNAEADAYRNVLAILNDILEMKEVDLDKEMDKEWNKCEPIDEGMGLEIASIEHEQFDNIAKHFFELGLKAHI